MLIKQDDERDIKVALTEKLLSELEPNGIIASEAPFFFGKRRADILEISKTIHAYEIKGKFDRLDKLPDQISDYMQSFDFVSVVVSKKHILKVNGLLPRRVGVLLYEDGAFFHRRKAQAIKRKNKSALASVLNRKETVFALKAHDVLPSEYRVFGVDELREYVSNNIKEEILIQHFIKHYRDRYEPGFKLFMADKGSKVHADDLRTLACQVSVLK